MYLHVYVLYSGNNARKYAPHTAPLRISQRVVYTRNNNARLARARVVYTCAPFEHAHAFTPPNTHTRTRSFAGLLACCGLLRGVSDEVIALNWFG